MWPTWLKLPLLRVSKNLLLGCWLFAKKRFFNKDEIAARVILMAWIKAAPSVQPPATRRRLQRFRRVDESHSPPPQTASSFSYSPPHIHHSELHLPVPATYSLLFGVWQECRMSPWVCFLRGWAPKKEECANVRGRLVRHLWGCSQITWNDERRWSHPEMADPETVCLCSRLWAALPNLSL